LESHWTAMLPHLILAGGGLIIFCTDAFWDHRPRWALFALAVAATVGAGLETLFGPGGGFAYMIDGGPFARYFTGLIAGITLLTLLFSRHYARVRRMDGDAFYGVILMAALGMVLTATARHWVLLFLGIELLAICLYILIAGRKGDDASAEAGLKYFVAGSVASAVLLFGIGLVYAATGEMDIAKTLSGTVVAGTDASILFFGLTLILAGIGFKISIVPFHLWTPDVYQGAPAPLAGFLSAGSKVAIVAALLRMALAAGPGVWAFLIPALWGLAAATMIVGNLTALAQDHLKRLLAYSAVAQMGYLLMALLAVRTDGAAAVMFYAAVYALMELGAFGAISLLSESETPDGPDRDAIDQYRGLGSRRPLVAGLLAISLFSLAGLPPTGGFIGKFALFSAAIGAGYTGLAVIGILTAIVSIYYYLRVAVALYMEPDGDGQPRPAADATGLLACGAVLVLVFLLGILPGGLFEIIGMVLHIGVV
jgi:NADH-quinone oxidoreductase subunit N